VRPDDVLGFAPVLAASSLEACVDAGGGAAAMHGLEMHA
jgi:hypothetical protein